MSRNTVPVRTGTKCRGPQVGEQELTAKRYRHPVVGEITVSYEALQLPADPDLTLITYTVEAGSPSEAAMQRLINVIESRQRHAARTVVVDVEPDVDEQGRRCLPEPARDDSHP